MNLSTLKNAIFCAIAFLLALPLSHSSIPSLSVRFPSQRPYLTLTPQDIAKAKERVAQFAWAKQALQNLVNEANNIVAKPFGKLPEKGDTEHRSIAGRLFTVALAHAFTGERRYAEWALDGLLAYADIYPSLPLTRGRCKVFTQSSLYEATWLVPIVQAYDLVADSGAFTDAQKKHIENDLLRAALVCFKVNDYEKDERIRDLHYRCYNFQAWHLSAIGLVGLAVKDADLVNYAVNSRYGFRHLVAHDIRDDGLFWERSVGYHHFVISALLPFTEAMMHCGVDLYNLTVPNDRAKDEDAHYVTDTSDKPKSLRLMFDAPFYLTFPDMSYMAMGDSDRGPLRANWTHLVGYHRYRDPKLAWLLQRDVPIAAGDVNRGRVGFLHYYRYSYRYEDVRLNGQPVKWERRDATFDVAQASSLQSGRQDVYATDGGVSQPDRYLLNDADVSDFTLEWTMTRLANFGGEDRAWVVFHVDAKNAGNRKTFALPSFLPELNRRYKFRLKVRGEQAKFFRDEQMLGSAPSVYRHAPNWHWLIYDAPQTEGNREIGKSRNEVWREGTFANTGVFQSGCSLFPSSGVAVLREIRNTQYENATAVALSYGPYGGGHGHPDKLSVAVYAQGRQWIPHFGSMPYETRWKAEWTAHTVSRNTVVVDGVSQKPTGARNVQWPVDNANDKVLGKLERFDPQRKFVSASCDHAYEGLNLKRTLQLAGNCVIDVFAVQPTRAGTEAPPLRTTRQFDYVLHVDGTLADSAAPLSPRSGALGNKCGYQHVEQKQGATVKNVTALTFSSGEKRLKVWVVSMAETEIILADGLTNSPNAKMPMIVLRCMGESAKFVTVIEPVDANNALRAVRIENGQLVLERTTGMGRVSLM